MSLKDDIKAAKKACDKLNAYVGGLPKNSIETPKYLELNRLANAAVNKLPDGVLRSRLAIEILGK